MVPRAQFLWAIVGATQYFVPSAQVQPSAVQPGVEPMQIQDAALLKRHIVAPRLPREETSAWKSSAFMFGALFATAGVSTLRSARLSMQAEAGAPPSEEPAAVDEAGGDYWSSPMTPGYLEMMPGVSKEFGGKVWDPLRFGEFVNEPTMNWFRAAELKHGRVCMAAFLGWLNQLKGGHWVGSFDVEGKVSFESLSKLDFFDAWYATPEKGKLQIILLIGIIEWLTEATGPNGHYTRAGNPGDLTFVKVAGITYPTIKIPAEKRSEFELAELKHGRLAMLGMASVFAAMAVPGSVPLLDGVVSTACSAVRPC